MSVNNREQLSGPQVAGNRVNLVGGLLAVMALGISVMATIGPVFPWWLLRDGWQHEWQWWNWEFSGLRWITRDQYSGLAVTVLGFFCGFCLFIGIISAIVGIKPRSLAILKFVRSTSAIIIVLSGLDLVSALTNDYLNPGFGVIMSFLAGLGLVIVVTGMIVLFAAQVESDQGASEIPDQIGDIEDFG